jgi:DHA1 family multidrug resistance protein-like MFS transporter
MGEEHDGRFLGMGRNALILSVTESVGQGILFLVSPFWALFVLEVGASLPVLGFLGFILGLTRIALQPPVGYLTDRIGRKRLVVWGGFVASFAPFVYLFATRWWHLVPGVVLEAFTNIVLPARQAMFADSVEPERRATAFAAIHTLFAVFSMTMPVLGGFMLERVGFLSGMRVFFLVSGVTMLLASIGRWRFLREDFTHEPGTDEGQGLRRVFLETFEPVRSLRALRVVLLGAFLYSLAVGVLTQYGVVYATGVIGLSTAQWGLVVGGMSAVGILTRLPTGRMIDRFGRSVSLLLSYAARPLFIIAFTVATGFRQVLLIQVVDNIFAYVQQPALEALVVDIASKERRGRTYGVMNVVPGVALTVSPLIGAALWEGVGAAWPFYFSAVASALAAVVVFTFLREPEGRGV